MADLLLYKDTVSYNNAFYILGILYCALVTFAGIIIGITDGPHFSAV